MPLISRLHGRRQDRPANKDSLLLLLTPLSQSSICPYRSRFTSHFSAAASLPFRTSRLLPSRTLGLWPLFTWFIRTNRGTDPNSGTRLLWVLADSLCYYGRAGKRFGKATTHFKWNYPLLDPVNLYPRASTGRSRVSLGEGNGRYRRLSWPPLFYLEADDFRTSRLVDPHRTWLPPHHRSESANESALPHLKPTDPPLAGSGLIGSPT